MSMDGYRVYLDGLDLSDDEQANLIKVAQSIVENIIDDLYKEVENHDSTQRKAT